MSALACKFERFCLVPFTGNLRALRNFRHRVCGLWRKWLNRRSQRAHMTWEKMDRLLVRYPLPQPHILSLAT
jgi:RNA-directed DNA polymerase